MNTLPNQVRKVGHESTTEINSEPYAITALVGVVNNKTIFVQVFFVFVPKL